MPHPTHSLLNFMRALEACHRVTMQTDTSILTFTRWFSKSFTVWEVPGSALCRCLQVYPGHFELLLLRSNILPDNGWIITCPDLNSRLVTTHTSFDLTILRLRYLAIFAQLEALQGLMAGYASSCHAAGFHPHLPHMVDLCYIPEIRTLLDDGSPWQSILSIRLNERISNLLPQALAKWMSNAQADLICVLVSSILPAYRGMTHLAALTYVKCSFCGAVRSFAVAIFHSCVNKPICLSYLVIDEPYDALTRSAYRRQRWSPAVFSIHDGSKVRIQNLLAAACRGDVYSTTSIEMDKLYARLICKLCPDKPMAWRTALFHCLHSHPDDEDADVTWTCILKNRVPEGQADDEVLSDQLYDEQRSWGCARCNPHVEMLGALRGNTKREVVDHVVKFHRVERPVLGQDFYRAVDSDPFLMVPASWIVCSGV